MTALANTNSAAVMSAARTVESRLRDWIVSDAYPLWASAGVDGGTGGFVESLDQDGTAVAEPRRARVQTRQVYAFACAADLGWAGAGCDIAIRGIRYFIEKYRRPDGLFRTLVAVDGDPLDDSVLLYDQAFALLGMAAAYKLSGISGEWEGQAEMLFGDLQHHLSRPGGGFDSGLNNRVPLLSNPHMHLFEACLEWRALSSNPVWRSRADDLGTLALTRFIDPATGVLREYFDEAWNPVPGELGRIIEPGHLFEWAGLLMRWGNELHLGAIRTALTLIEIAERAGVRDGVAVDMLLDDLTVHTATARLWPQTERLKAAALAAAATGGSAHWMHAVAAANTLRRYLATRTPGLWHDRLSADGGFLAGPAPAGNFYHIVGAVLAFTMALRRRVTVE